MTLNSRETSGAMSVSLHGVSGPGKAIERTVKEGETFTVGRAGSSDLVLTQDKFLSGFHFSVACGAGRALIRDLGSSNGTFVNGNRVTQFDLKDGDSIQAGSTVFLVRIRAAAQALLSPGDILSAQREPVYAVLDAAHDKNIYPFVLNCGMPFCSLYRGKAELELEWVAPYLLYLAPGSPAMTQLIAQGWANSWGIFLTCSQPMPEIRKQLRRSLKVSIEGGREQVYFRFYDPRVLRVFLPIAELVQIAEFAGPISSFLMEGEQPDVLLRFYLEGGAIRTERVGLSTEGVKMTVDKTARISVIG